MRNLIQLGLVLSIALSATACVVGDDAADGADAIDAIDEGGGVLLEDFSSAPDEDEAAVGGQQKGLRRWGYFYEHANYKGARIGYQTRSDACDRPSGRGQPDMRSDTRAWNDRISSLTFNNPGHCVVGIYQHPNYTGIHRKFNGSTSYVGDDINDRATSWVVNRAAF